MKSCSLTLFAAVCLVHSASAAFYGDAPDANHPWAVHDENRPQPPRVEPAEIVGGAPSDAVVLFDGTEASFENWVHARPDKSANPIGLCRMAICYLSAAPGLF